jgi:CMP-N,N'-diacetyllegionaminic acid synthase
MHRVLFVIPARSGSKGVKDKNLQYVGERDLIERTILSARNARIESDICFSSDSQDYLDRVSSLDSDVLIVQRGKELSNDEALTIDVISHALESLNKPSDYYDYVALLQVTTPFRTSTHIEEAFSKINEGYLDSLVSVVDTHGYHPFRMKRIENDLLVNYIDQGFEDMRPRQKLPKVYLRNGAFYITKTDLFRKNKALLSGKIGYYEMDDISSVNIDQILDLEFAQFIAKKYDI